MDRKYGRACYQFAIFEANFPETGKKPARGKAAGAGNRCIPVQPRGSGHVQMQAVFPVVDRDDKMLEHVVTKQALGFYAALQAATGIDVISAAQVGGLPGFSI